MNYLNSFDQTTDLSACLKILSIDRRQAHVDGQSKEKEGMPPLSKKIIKINSTEQVF